MAENKQAQPSYMANLMHFYFAPRLRSVFTMLYLILFGYTLIYYFHNVLLAINFVFYTMYTSSVFQSIDHLFWGIFFIISLIIPFSMSLTAIFLLFRIWKEQHDWSLELKIIITALIIVGGLFIIVLMDYTAHIVARQDALQSFIEDVGLNGRI